MDRLQIFYTDRKLTAIDKVRIQNKSNTQNGMLLLLNSINKATWTTRAGEKIDQDRLWAAYDRALTEIDTHITCTGSRYESAVQILCEYYGIKYQQEVEIPGTDSTLDFLLPKFRLIIHIDGEHHRRPAQIEKDKRTDKLVDDWLKEIYDHEFYTIGIQPPIVVIRIDTDTVKSLGWDVLKVMTAKTQDAIFGGETYIRM